ncbi:MAG TPA: Yip1 family protein [Steroidobacteraceae bacterium]|nr:Yip1 family protein [Steroidobacteraceae bacterium]
MDANKIVARAKGMLITPRTEWAVAAAEPDSIGGLYSGYILLLAAIPALVTFLAYTVIGVSVPLLGTYRVGIATALTSALVRYALSLVFVYVVALIIDALAPTFGAEKNSVQSLKTVAYSYTALWVISILGVIPGLALLATLAGGIYSIYLLNMGLPSTMKCPSDKTVGYTALTVVIAIVLYLVLAAVVAALGGLGLGVGRGLSGFGQPSVTGSSGFQPGTAGAALQNWSQRVKAASDQAAAAQKSGDKDAQAKAMGALVGAALGSNGKVESLSPDRLRPFLPDSLGALKRTQLQVQRNGAMGMQVSTGTATYSDGSQHTVTLTIADTGSLKGVFGFASGWAGVEQESQTDTGYDKLYKTGGQLIHEKWDTKSNYGEYGVVVAERFSVTAQGNADKIDDLKGDVAAINLSGLEALKNEGVQAN